VGRNVENSAAFLGGCSEPLPMGEVVGNVIRSENRQYLTIREAPVTITIFADVISDFPKMLTHFYIDPLEAVLNQLPEYDGYSFSMIGGEARADAKSIAVGKLPKDA
jgi:hypothetical protein